MDCVCVCVFFFLVITQPLSFSGVGGGEIQGTELNS